MSSFLHRVGRWSFRHRWTVLVSWLIVLALGGGGAAVFGQGTDNSFSIPGTQSQQALDQLSRTFPEVSGSSAQVIVVAADGHRVTEHAYRAAVDHAVDAFGDIPGVRAVTSPYDDTVKGLLSADRTAGLIRIQLTHETTTVSDHTKDAITHENAQLRAALPHGAKSVLGGDLFAQNLPAVSATEAVGLLIAIVVLVLVFRSFIAAGMPLAGALLGVGISMTLIFLSTAFGTISSTTPMLALMLGLAVGIDYALFIISRHLQQLKEGMGAEESVAKATATSGSAVVFAGTTVLIALVGLAIARIPFLTTMGIAAAAAVAIAVMIAVTLTPALLGFARRRLMPSQKAIDRARRRAERAESGTGGFFHGWVRAVTRFPIVTVAAVVVVLGLASAPALGLRLALPDAGMLPAGDQARQNYDLVAEHFGPGFNGPLIVTGTIIASDDPVGLMHDIGDDIAGMPGVKEVVLATPNRSADTGIVQVIPTTGPDDPATADLVQRIRDDHAHFLKKYDVDLAVTGQTAVGIDVSARLGGALLPFGIFVVGLSLVLLAMVFRSVWVPVKATIGYLLSVGAAFGAVTWVFIDGGMADALEVAAVGPIISFLPIVLMGVLFGLAMDYEVFLVSRIREEYVHNGGDARRAIERGFVGSASVVTAAALIMFGVFAAFVPEGDTNIKPIALGLAVGVFVDAFLVRMTLVPAVLALLGKHAWWMPRWLDRVLPSFDVEGESIAHELALADWPGRPAAVAARAVSVGAAGPHDDGAALVSGLDVVVAPGETLVLQSDDAAASAVLAAIGGRTTAVRGDLKVLDLVLPVRAAAVRRRVGLVVLDGVGSPAETIAAASRGRPELMLIDGLERILDPDLRREAGEALIAAQQDNARHGRAFTVIAAARDAAAVAERLPGSGVGIRVLRLGRAAGDADALGDAAAVGDADAAAAAGGSAADADAATETIESEVAR